jgi:phage FluMu protein Com
MPVRFRCSYCNQLLGISRRKIGLAVKCPTCQGQVIVPPRDTEEQAAPAMAPVGAPPRQFEQSDFLEMLEKQPALNAPASPVPASASPSARVPSPPRAQEPMPDFPAPEAEKPPEVDVEPLSPPAASGWLLTPRKLTLLIVAIIVLLALAFAAGVLVGMALSGSPDKGGSTEDGIQYPQPHDGGVGLLKGPSRGLCRSISAHDATQSVAYVRSHAERGNAAIVSRVDS